MVYNLFGEDATTSKVRWYRKDTISFAELNPVEAVIHAKATKRDESIG